jgi:PilZ domain
MAFGTGISGRMEKRLPIAIVVRLAHVLDPPKNGAEMTYTDNVSAHGARVVSNRLWQMGDVARVTSLKDDSTLLGRVVYCQKLEDSRYCIGLNFVDRGGVTWSTYRTYSHA